MPTPFRPALAGVAAAVATLGLLPGTAVAGPAYTLNLAEPITYSFSLGGETVDFKASGYCTGTWHDCGKYTDYMRWHDVPFVTAMGDDRHLPNLVRSVYIPDHIAPEQYGSYDISDSAGWRDGWPGLGAQDSSQDDYSTLLSWNDAGVVFRTEVFLDETWIPLLYFATVSQGENYFTAPAFDVAGMDNLVLHYAMDVASVPEINGSGFAYIAFILGSLGLWLYSGAGRREPEAVAA